MSEVETAVIPPLSDAFKKAKLRFQKKSLLWQISSGAPTTDGAKDDPGIPDDWDLTQILG